MAKTENLMDFSSTARRLAKGSVSAVVVPRYALYGEPAPPREWFVNVEPLDQRARAQGWTIDPHTHPKFAQVVFVTDGFGEMSIDGDTVPFEAPAALVVPPFRIHSFRYHEASAGWVLTIEINYLGELLARAPDLKRVLEWGGAIPLSATAREGVSAGVAGLLAELSGDLRGKMIATEIHLLRILLTLLREGAVEDKAAQSPRGELVERFLAVVEQRYREQPDLDSIAAELGVSTAQLRLACKSARGVSPLVILHDRLIAEAKRCLTYTTMSVAEIGYALGFEDAAYFSRFFTKRLGHSPTEFRRARY